MPGSGTVRLSMMSQPDPGRQWAGGWIEFSPAPPPCLRICVA